MSPDYLPPYHIAHENDFGYCRDQSASGAQCSLPRGHGGAHRAGPETWVALEVA